VIENELGRSPHGSIVPRGSKVGKVFGGKEVISHDLLDVTDPNHDSINESDKEDA
jgi:hypothetical protein